MNSYYEITSKIISDIEIIIFVTYSIGHLEIEVISTPLGEETSEVFIKDEILCERTLSFQLDTSIKNIEGYMQNDLKQYTPYPILGVLI